MPGQASFRHTVEEHLDVLALLLDPLLDRGTETVLLADALKRLTANDILSPVPMPLFRNAQMDGYAVHSADIADAPVVLPVAPAEIAAGPGDPEPLASGTAVRIMTGAPMPPGADAVVQVEQTRQRDDGVEILVPSSPGHSVREAGSEIIAPGLVPQPGELFDSNTIALCTATIVAGGTVVHSSRVRDDGVAFRAALDTAIYSGAELIVTSGGISMGEHEVVRETLEPLGVQVGKVAMQPGGPQGYGRYRNVPILCFPGNPVSHLVAALAAAELLIVVAAGSTGVLENDEVEVLWLS
jgi:molybdopterin molybdotransferase